VRPSADPAEVLVEVILDFLNSKADFDLDSGVNFDVDLDNCGGADVDNLSSFVKLIKQCDNGGSEHI
jgi:hypothetical protein